MGRWEGEKQLPAILIGVAQTVYAGGLTPVQKHYTHLYFTQVPCRLYWCQRARLRSWVCCLGAGERGMCWQRHPAVQRAKMKDVGEQGIEKGTACRRK